MVALLRICSVLFVIFNITNAESSTAFTIDDLPSIGTCGVYVSDKSLGGEEVRANDFPWVALIHYEKRNRTGFLCGGVLINENYVLTAAQCISNPTVQGGYVFDSVRLGEHDLRTDPDCEENDCADPVVDIPIAETIVHENYVPTSKSHENDIALIRLQRPAPITDSIKPICLPIKDLQNKVHDGSALTVAGFGRNENGTQSQVKLKLEVNGINLDECKNIYQNASINLTNNHLCAGGDEGTCYGSSGNALMADHESDGISFTYAVGIVSFGPAKCGSSGYPDVYTRVDQYIDWILEHMKK